MIVVPFTCATALATRDRARPRTRRSRTRPSGRSRRRSSRRATRRHRRRSSGDRCRAPSARRSPHRPRPASRCGAPASSLSATTWSTGSSSASPALRRASHDVARRVELVVLDERPADRLAHRLEERVRHRAADEQAIDPRDQVLDDLDLVRDLRAAEDRDERPRPDGRARRPRYCSSFSISSPAPASGITRTMRLHRRVGAMRRAERVVDVDVGERRQRRGERGVVLLFLRVEAQVLEQHDASRRGDLRRPARPRARCSRSANADRRAEQLAKPRGHGPQAHLRTAACPWAGRGARRARRIARRRRARTRMVGSDARMRVSSPMTPSLQRDVEVHAHEHAAALDGQVANRAFCSQPLRDELHAAGPRTGSSSPTRCRTTRAPSRSRRP